MYDVLPSFVLGFHGCDHDVAERVFAGKTTLQSSKNGYDWLGHGVYFWENSPARAQSFAHLIQQERPPTLQSIKKPSVIGAVIDLGLCLNLMDFQFIKPLKLSFEELELACRRSGTQMPDNKSLGGSTDLLLRHRDCAVIEMLHVLRQKDGLHPFQSARGVFIEGRPIYPNAGIHELNHIQICVRDPRCIKGYFRVIKDAPPPKARRKKATLSRAALVGQSG